MTRNKSQLTSLLKLLDEPNQQAASLIMAELLEHEPELENLLPELQESDDTLIRKRVHQLETILFLRRRRRAFAEKLKSGSIGMIEGLIEIHLQWYDNDTSEALWKEWDKLKEAASKNNLVNIESIAYFMRKMGFSAQPSDDIQPDYYCFGTVLEELAGTDLILCAIAQEIGRNSNIELKLVQVLENFGLIDADRRVLNPKDGWRMHSPLKDGSYKVWDTCTVLRYAASMLFLAAVSSDSFRYVNTIGTCLAKSIGEDNINFLPFPYNQVTNNKKKKDNKRKKGH
jgi:hypothetical protein